MAMAIKNQLIKTRALVDSVVDLIWPRLSDPLSTSPVEPEWPESLTLKGDSLESVHDSLREACQDEADRFRTVESKLLGISGLAPVAMAIIVASLMVLANSNAQAFTRFSVLSVGLIGGYIALSFLRAILAAIAGLKRRPFVVVLLKDLFPLPNENKSDYLARNCSELAKVIRGNRVQIDAKVTWLAIAHTAIRNAVVGLLLLVIVIIVLAVLQA